jgi:hypothetical protein
MRCRIDCFSQDTTNGAPSLERSISKPHSTTSQPRVCGPKLELWSAIERMRWRHLPHAKANGCYERALSLTSNEWGTTVGKPRLLPVQGWVEQSVKRWAYIHHQHAPSLGRIHRRTADQLGTTSCRVFQGGLDDNLGPEIPGEIAALPTSHLRQAGLGVQSFVSDPRQQQDKKSPSPTGPVPARADEMSPQGPPAQF